MCGAGSQRIGCALGAWASAKARSLRTPCRRTAAQRAPPTQVGGFQPKATSSGQTRINASLYSLMHSHYGNELFNVVNNHARHSLLNHRRSSQRRHERTQLHLNGLRWICGKQLLLELRSEIEIEAFANENAGAIDAHDAHRPLFGLKEIGAFALRVRAS